jgi:mRNA interferase MazF
MAPTSRRRAVAIRNHRGIVSAAARRDRDTRIAERGDNPGFYVIASRTFIAGNDDIATVVCAPIYRQILGLETEVVVDVGDGVRHASAIHCDFLVLMFKDKLRHRVGALSSASLSRFNHAISVAMRIDD